MDRARGDPDRVGGVVEMPVAEAEWRSGMGVGMRLPVIWEETKVGRAVRELDMCEMGVGCRPGGGEVWITGGEEDSVDVASCEWFWKGEGLGL
jgi:hypothetical protein